MYLHLSETTIKTILGTILQNQSKIFPYIQYLAYLQLIFTSVINLFKNIPIPDFFDFGHVLVFLGLFQICPNHKYPYCGGFKNFVLSCTKFFFPMYSHIVKIMI